MGLIDDLAGRTVFVDTDVLIYHLQNHATYGKIVSPVLETIGDLQLRGFTSAVVLCELFTKPHLVGDRELLQRCRRCVQETATFETLPITTEVAEAGAILRAEYNLRTPDALNVAAARVAGVETFVTNDHRMRRVATPAVLIVDDYA